MKRRMTATPTTRGKLEPLSVPAQIQHQKSSAFYALTRRKEERDASLMETLFFLASMNTGDNSKARLMNCFPTMILE